MANGFGDPSSMHLPSPARAKPSRMRGVRMHQPCQLLPLTPGVRQACAVDGAWHCIRQFRLTHDAKYLPLGVKSRMRALHSGMIRRCSSRSVGLFGFWFLLPCMQPACDRRHRPLSPFGGHCGSAPQALICRHGHRHQSVVPRRQNVKLHGGRACWKKTRGLAVPRQRMRPATFSQSTRFSRKFSIYAGRLLRKSM